MTAAATLATFADFRIVKTRKLAQFVFEVPIEKADEALTALGGLPRSDGERWCGIALVHKESAALSADAGHDGTEEQTVRRPTASGFSTPAQALPEAVAGDVKPRRRFSELPRSAQAAMLCENPVFQNWTLTKGRSEGADVVIWVRRECKVESRAQFDTDGPAGDRWARLALQYYADTGQMTEMRS